MAKFTVETLVINNGKATAVMVKMENYIFATAKLGGKWDNKNALKELANNSKRFTIAPKFASLNPIQIKTLVG